MAPLTMSFEVDREMSELATEIARRTGESEEEAVRRALRERRLRLRARPRRKRRPMDRRGAPPASWKRGSGRRSPTSCSDQPPMTKEEKEELLGYGPEGF